MKQDSITLIDKKKLPKSWGTAFLEEIADIGAGNPAPQGEQYFRNGIYPFVRVQDMGRLGANKHILNTADCINQGAAKRMKLFQKGAVLFTKSGASSLLNQRAILKSDMYVVSHIAVAIPRGGVLSEYLYYWLKIIDFNHIAHATTLPSIPLSKVNRISVSLASTAEQSQIVNIVEQLFSDLDNAIDNLKKARDQLKIYRQAVLKNAFNGSLTENWRKNKKNLTSANDLIEQIKQKRKAVDDSKYGKRHRKMDISFTDINKPPFNLPSQWMWCRIKDLILDLTDYHANGSYKNLKANVKLFDTPDYALIIRATNFEKNDFINVAKYITKKAYEFLSRSKLFGGEILIGKIGNAGKVYLMPHLNKPASLAMNLFALRFSVIDSKYIYYHIISPFSDKDISSYVKGVGNSTIDKKSIRSLLIALPSLEEQDAIIQEIESRFSISEKMKETIENSLNQAEVLRQSILKQAFEGRLTEEWRKNNPELVSRKNSAKALLEKIKAEREALKNTKKRKK